MNIFQRDHQGMNLSPGSRALLRLIKSFAITGLLAVLPLVAPLETSVVSGAAVAIDWGQEGRILLLAFIIAVVHAVVKYITASGDAPLPVPADAPQHSAAETIPAPLWQPAPDPGLTTQMPKVSTTKAAQQDTPNIDISPI